MTLCSPTSAIGPPTESAAPTCLLVIPRHFYSFEAQIRSELERRGYTVVVANDEYPEGTVGKIFGKLQIPYIFSATERAFDRNYLAGARYDIALIFKGRGMSTALIRKLRIAAREVVGYNWDSFELNRSPLRWYRSATRYFTFDYRDAEAWSLPVIELFSAARTQAEGKRCDYEVSAIVRNHSQRLRYIDAVLDALQPKTSYVSIFELNVFTFIWNFIRSPRLYLKYRRHISFKPLPYTEYSRVMSASTFTIDYAHHTQTGITMRCFEAVNSKTKIITNNPYMPRSPHFAADDYVVFKDAASAATLKQGFERARAAGFASRPRTISDFIGDLIGTRAVRHLPKS